MTSKRNILPKVLLLAGAVILLGAIVVARPPTPTHTTSPEDVLSRSEYEVFDKNGKKIDYGREYLSDGRVNSARERIFSDLDQDLTAAVESGETLPEGEVIYAENQDSLGAVAIFRFAENKKIILETYIESPLFYLPVAGRQLIDLDADGDKDIFLLNHSGNYLDIERPWFFLRRRGEFVLATPLEPAGVHKEQALSGEVAAGNAMEIRAHAGGDPVWLRDLDGDRTLEVITLDKGTFDDEGITEVIKRVYKLQDDSYVLKEETTIARGSQEEKEINSWPRIPESGN